MILSVATANYYFIPFEQSLEIIAQAGFEWIELDLYWERKTWAMAQHLRSIDPREVVRQVRQSGLRISSIHDGGGVLEQPASPQGWVNPQLDAYLDQLGYAPGCLVFHTPHIEGDQKSGWWQEFWRKGIKVLEPYRDSGQVVTIENMPFFDGYTVPMTTPQQLQAFTCESGLHVTLDTTHYAQIGIDICQAAQILNGKVKSIHFSDFAGGKTHVFPGDGELDFTRFYQVIDPLSLYAITLECSPGYLNENAHTLSRSDMIDRLKTARARLEQILSAARG